MKNCDSNSELFLFILAYSIASVYSKNKNHMLIEVLKEYEFKSYNIWLSEVAVKNKSIELINETQLTNLYYMLNNYFDITLQVPEIKLKYSQVILL